MKNKCYILSRGALLPLLLVIGALLAVTSGCVNLKSKPDRVQQYALGASLQQELAVSDPAAIYISRPNLPGYLNGRNLQYRDASSEVVSLRQSRWAEPLDQGVARALAECWLQSGASSVSGYYPWPRKSNSSPQLKVNFYRLEAFSDGRIEVVADWQLLGAAGGVEKQGQFRAKEISWQLGDPESLVRGLNAALLQLIQQVK